MNAKSNKRINAKPHISESDQELKSVLYWLMMAVTIYILFYAPFHTALFNGYSAQYDSPIFSTLLGASMLLILTAMYFFFNWRLQDWRDLLGVLIWLLPLSYWISSFSAASPSYANTMIVIELMCASLFIVGAYLARNVWGARIIQASITVSCYAVVLFGLACAFGNMYSRDAIMITEVGYRLTAVFQYANAYAALLMAAMLCSLYYITHSRKWYWIAANALMLVPIAMSFWLTQSRGAIVALPVIFLAILPVLPLTKQLLVSVYAMIGIGASLTITGFVTDKSTEIYTEVAKTISEDMKSAETLSWINGSSLSGWGVVAGVSLLAAAIIFSMQYWVSGWLERKLQILSRRKLSQVALPVGLVVIGALGAVLVLATPLKNVLPDTVQSRLENINFEQHSVLERVTFYKDSIKVFKEHPILGSGGGGWAALYEKFQNNPYTARQAHNFFLQSLIEVGLVGFIILIILVIGIFSLFIRKVFAEGKDHTGSHLLFYFVAVSILIHSILDFEMSYVFFGAVVFLCLGGMTSILDMKPSWINKLAEYVSSSRRFIYCGVVSAIAIVFFTLSVINVSASNSYKAAMAYAVQGKSLNEILEPLDSAIKARKNPDYIDRKAAILLQVYSQVEDAGQKQQYWNLARETLEEGRKAEPYNRVLLERQYYLYMSAQQKEEALRIIKEGMDKFPWELSFYERAGTLYNDQWNKARQQDDEETMKLYGQLLQDNYATVQAKVEDLAKLPEGQLQGRAFYLSSLIRFSVGQVYMISGETDQALAELQPAAMEANEENKSLDPGIAANQALISQNKQIIRWYLALTMKNGQLDQALYESYVGTYPDEKEQIEAVVAVLK